MSFPGSKHDHQQLSHRFSKQPGMKTSLNRRVYKYCREFVMVLVDIFRRIIQIIMDTKKRTQLLYVKQSYFFHKHEP